MKEIKLKKVKQIIKPNMNGLEVEYEVNGEKKIECFVGSEYWLEKVNNEERFKSKIKNNVNSVRIQSEDKTEVKELKKYIEEVI